MTRDPLRPRTTSPFRSPRAVSEALQDILRGKVVCELGCAEGDNLVFMSRYAKSVFGMERQARRYALAQERGLEIVVGDYLKDPIPDADVYYCWPDNASTDDEAVVSRIVTTKPAFAGHIVVGGDPQCTLHPEEEIVRRLAEQGELREVPYDEGSDVRQHGIFLLAVLRAADLRA